MKKQSSIPFFAIALVFSFFCSSECLSQLSRLNTNSSNINPKQNLFSNVPIQNSYSLGERLNDFNKIKSEYNRLNNSLNSLLKVTSDSSLYHYNNDSIKVLITNQLNYQQEFITEFSTKTENPIENNTILSQNNFFSNAKDKLSGNITNEKLNHILKESQSNLHSIIKNNLQELGEGFQIENLPGNEVIGEPVERLSTFFENFNEPSSIYDQTLSDSKNTAISKVNRKVGFESIEYKEVVLQSQKIENPTVEIKKWKVGLLYNLTEGISIYSMLQGYLGYKIFPKSILLFGGSTRLESKNTSVGSIGYGLNVGFRREFSKNWFANFIYERNHVKLKRPKPYDHLSFEGTVNDGSLGIGKTIPITQNLSTVFTGIWSPFYNSSRSLQGTRFGFKIGFEVDWNNIK